MTSNSDTGLGTLRDALLRAAANGDADKDEIRFNIAGSARADVTITLNSPLPGLSSNLSIDGTTQSSSPFGVSNARIIITPNRTAYVAGEKTGVALSITNKKDIEIYGLLITGFRDLLHTVPPPRGPLMAAIAMEAAENIIIGAAGKGNVLTDNIFSIFIPGPPEYTISNLIKVQSNIIGLTETGTSLPTPNSDIRVGCNNFTFGGDNPADRNYLQCSFTFKGNNLLVKGNHLGVPYNGIISSPNFSSLTMEGTNLEVANNTLGRSRFNFLNSSDIRVQKNSNVPSGIPLIDFVNCENGLVGGESPGDMNVFILQNMVIPINSTNSKNIVIAKNSVTCSETPYKINSPVTGIPDIKVLINNDTEYSGTASPNAEVYIYKDNTSCSVCNPVLFYTKAIADASGNWKITGNFTNKRWVSNATFLNNSSEFTQPSVEKIIPAANYRSAYCGLSNGRISLSNLKNTIKVEWYNQANVKVGEGETLADIPPGNYRALCYNGNCYVETFPVTISNINLSINAGGLSVTQPSCNLANGAIRGLSASAPDPLVYEWRNGAGDLIATQADLEHVGPGAYTLSVKINGCVKTYGPVTLTDPGFPVINTAAMVISHAFCGNSVGSIKNVQASGSGTLTYTWKNEQLAVVGNTADLVNMPPGRYTLELKDGSTCAISYSAPIEIPAVSLLSMDQTNVQLKGSACNASNGSIKGITVSGATKYEWFRSDGSLLQTTSIPEIDNLAPGNYLLKASNPDCEKISALYSVPQLSAVPFPAYDITTVYASCNQNNGSVSVRTGTGILPSAIRWLDAAGNLRGTQLTLGNLDAGNYRLYLSDANGCEVLYNTYTVSRVPMLQLDDTNLKVVVDECAQGKGEISGLNISGGQPPYLFEWKNESGTVVASTLNLQNQQSGSYTLSIYDAASCTISRSYTINNINTNPPAPLAPEVQLCAPGPAVITLTSPISQHGDYKLYENINDQQAIQESTNGVFRVEVNSSKTFYISFNTGDCESQRQPVTVTIATNNLKIPNLFTPNGDGINDTWEIPGMEHYPEAMIRLFNRYGSVVYQSRRYTSPFAGRKDNADLPAGTYFYLIELRKNCNPLSGSITIIR